MANAPPKAWSNRLAEESSPYLIQHATNPVDWYPWGPEALAAARDSGKPVLLSIGYSACHWCHVMAHESFEDEATAQVMNALFINIKVDREERPDLDRIYQLSHQLLTRRGGGWPLTMFLTHDDQRPFFGGTYFPNVARLGMPAFVDLLQRVAAYYEARQSELRDQNQMLVDALSQIDAGGDTDVLLDATPLAAARAQLAQRFDRDHGGWGNAPKFPHANTILRLLRDWHATAHATSPDLHALFMATLTLRRMADGGLQDHLGGGFSRYSVDDRWLIPHFEKMLYDNGALLSAYSAAALATGDEFYAQVAANTADFLLRELQASSGGFHSSFDADSEGHEGRFYVWQPDEIGAVLGDADAALFAARFGLDQPANFEDHWHLHAARDIEDLAADGAFGSRQPRQLQQRLDAARAKLLARRSQRVWPGRDDKILTSWNAIAIRGLADAARALQRNDYADAATRALGFVRTRLWRDGRLLAVSKDERAHLPAYLDDHVFLADATLALQSLRFRADEFAFACELAEIVLAHFEDRARGGFYFTADDHENLIHRSRSFGDDAMPAGNAIAAQFFTRLGFLLGEERYLRAAEATLRAGWSQLSAQPIGHTSLLTALEEYLSPPVWVILRGSPAAMAGWQQQFDRLYTPRMQMLAIPADAANLPPALAAKAARGDVVAYVCRGSTCTPPLTSLVELRAALQ
ncbi:MAG: thioredoxin domain-containing protein [Pseudomonadota bacterium]